MLKIYAPSSECEAGFELPNVVYITKISPEPDWKYGPHKHENLCLAVFVLSGKGHYIIENEQYEAVPGDVVIFEQGVVHSERSDTEEPLDAWVISIKDLRVAGREPGTPLPAGASPVLHMGEKADVVRGCYEAIFEACENPGKYSGLRCRLSASVLLSYINEAVEAQDPAVSATKKRPLASSVLTYIDNNYPQPLTLSSIAEKFFVSPDYLSHVIRADVGTSPIEYLIERRMGESQKLLLSTHLTVQEIAELVGYPSASHFSNAFKKKLGLSPGSFRKKYNVTNLRGLKDPTYTQS